MATKHVTVGTSKRTLIERNEARSAVLICNSHSSAIIYVTDDSDVTATSGFPIFPKTTLLMSYDEGVEVEKRLLVISDTATTYVFVWEWFKRTPELETPDLQDIPPKDPAM